MNKIKRRPRPIKDGYARQTLRQMFRRIHGNMGQERDNIFQECERSFLTPQLIEMQRVKLDGVRILRKFKNEIRSRSKGILRKKAD